MAFLHLHLLPPPISGSFSKLTYFAGHPGCGGLVLERFQSWMMLDEGIQWYIDVFVMYRMIYLVFWSFLLSGFFRARLPSFWVMARIWNAAQLGSSSLPWLPPKFVKLSSYSSSSYNEVGAKQNFMCYPSIGPELRTWKPSSMLQWSKCQDWDHGTMIYNHLIFHWHWLTGTSFEVWDLRTPWECPWSVRPLGACAAPG